MLRIFPVLIVYLILNIMVGIRIQKSLLIEKTNCKIIFWIIFLIIAFSFVVAEIFPKILPFSATKIIYNIGCIYLGLFVYMILLFTISFFLTLIFKNGKLDYYSISIVLSIILVICGFYFENTTKIKNYDVKIETKLENTSSMKVALISDIHIGYTFGQSHLNKMITEINDLNPDIIVIAGDLIDSDLDIALHETDLSVLSNLKSKYGTFFALGNHDCYTQQIERLSNILRENNITVLNDDYSLINDDLYIIGRVDPNISTISSNSYVSERNSLNSIISDIDKSKPTLVIDHSPNNMQDSIENGIDIQVSGHTHNGQLFPFNFVVNKTSPIGYGYKKINDTNVIVSSGYGTWGPPIRTTGHSEIALINIYN